MVKFEAHLFCHAEFSIIFMENMIENSPGVHIFPIAAWGSRSKDTE